jgi:hypothetical protein
MWFRVSRRSAVFAFGLLKNRDVWVGVFPQFEEVLKRFFGFRRFARERGGAAKSELGKRIVRSPIRLDSGGAPIAALVIHSLTRGIRLIPMRSITEQRRPSSDRLLRIRSGSEGRPGVHRSM